MKFISVSINKWYKSDVCMHCRPSHQRATFTATKKKENTTVTASYVNKMKISVSVTFVLALWLSMNMVNASPLSHSESMHDSIVSNYRKRGRERKRQSLA